MRAEPDAVRGAAMTLYKQALASGDTVSLAGFLRDAVNRDPGAAGPLAALLRAERARLVKLKTLGLTGDFDRKVALTDALLQIIGARGAR